MSSHQENIHLDVKNLGLSYYLKDGFLRNKQFWALKDISFSLYAGESLGVLGRNGVGKSTLLQALAGIMEPDTGTIECHVDKISLLALQIGFIPYLSGRENSILCGLLLGMRRAAIEGALDEIHEFSDLGDFYDEPISTYSSGMRARLGFTIALQLDPDLYLIDEIMSVGDEAFREKSMSALEEKLKQNKSLIFVSHAPAQIQKLCSRAIWIEHGEIVMAGDVEPVLDAYRTASTQ